MCLSALKSPESLWLISQVTDWLLASRRRYLSRQNGGEDDLVQIGGTWRRWGRQDCFDHTSKNVPGQPHESQLTVLQLCLNHFVETYDPTIEDSYRKQVVIDSQSCMLEVLDTAGQEEYTALRDQWIRDGEGFVLVYSITSRSSFTRVRRFHSQIQRVKESSNASSPTTAGYLPSPVSQSMMMGGGQAPVMLVGNKSDRVTEREVSTQEGTALAKEMGCDFVEASAKNCINVEKAFYEVVRALRKQRHDTQLTRTGTIPGRSGGPVGMSDSRDGRKRAPKESKSGHKPRCTIL